MTANTTTETAVSYTDLLRNNRNFRYLWFGQIVSLLGDWFNLVASAALVGMLTQSGLAVGSLFVVRMLAPFLVSPIAGVVADRYNRKYVLIAADLIRAAVVLAFLLVRNPGDVWLLYTLTAVQMAMSGFFDPAHTAILPDISNPRELGAVNALSSATWSVMLALGAALGGLFSGTFGMYPAFVLDTFTFLLSALLLAQIRMPANLASAAADRTVAAAVGQYLRGLRYLRAHLDVLVVALQKAVMALFFATAFQVLQVAIAQQVFTVGQGGGTSLGLMFGLTGVGSGLGPILARKLTGEDPRSLKEAIAYGYVLAIAGIIVTSPPPQPAHGAPRLLHPLHRQRHHLGLLNPPPPPNGPRRSPRPRLRQRLHVLLPRQRPRLQPRRRRPRHHPHHPHHHLDHGRHRRRPHHPLDPVGHEEQARDGLRYLFSSASAHVCYTVDGKIQSVPT